MKSLRQSRVVLFFAAVLILWGIDKEGFCTSGGPDFYQVTVPGSWTEDLGEGDYVLAYDGSYFDIYEFNLSAPANITVTLSSVQFDTYLLLAAVDPVTWTILDMWQNDDYSGTDSGLTMDLQPGTYWIAANSYEGGATGGYTLGATLNGIQRVRRQDRPVEPLHHGRSQLHGNHGSRSGLPIGNHRTGHSSSENGLRLHGRRSQQSSLGRRGLSFRNMGPHGGSERHGLRPVQLQRPHRRVAHHGDFERFLYQRPHLRGPLPWRLPIHLPSINDSSDEALASASSIPLPFSFSPWIERSWPPSSRPSPKAPSVANPSRLCYKFETVVNQGGDPTWSRKRHSFPRWRRSS